MKNVESEVQGIAEKICHGLAKHIGIGMLGAAMLLAPTTLKADSAITEGQYLQWLAQVSGANLKSGASSADYINWAKSLGINPSSGWDASQKMDQTILATTLVQALNLKSSKNNNDAVRVLQREGIDLSDVNKVTKDTLVDLVDDFGVAARLGALDPQLITPANKPKKHDDDEDKDKDKDKDHKTTICHKGHTITVDNHALKAHLAHGDTIGPCHVTKHGHDRDDDDKGKDKD